MTKNGKQNIFTNVLLVLMIVVLVFILDRVTKNVAESLEHVLYLPGPLNIAPTYNTGGAFSILSDATAAITIISAIALALLAAALIMCIIFFSKTTVVALSLIVAGGIGNLADRLFFGHVIDFISPTFIDFPTFNISDVSVCIGMALLLIVVIREFTSHESGVEEEKIR